MLATTTLPAGTSPNAVGVAPNGRVYVANEGSDNVTVIDSATDTVLTTLTVGDSPRTVGVAPNGRVYVANFFSNNVTVIDSVTDAVLTTVSVGTNPFGVAVAPNGRVYIANYGSNNVTVIDSATNAVLTTVSVGTNPVAVAVAPNGRVYVANQTTGDVTVIDSATNAVLTTLLAGTTPDAVAVAPNGRVYVVNFGSDNVTVIDSVTDAVLTTVSVGTNPVAVGVAPNGRVYVVNFGSDNVTVIDSVTDAVLATLPVGTTPFAVGVAPNGRVYVVNFDSNNVTVIDSVTDAVLATLPTGAGPIAVGVAPNNHVYVANVDSNDVSVFAPPVLLTISPAQGVPAGGNSVTLTGTDLTGATSVLFGTTPGTNVVVNPGGTALTVTVPASSGTVPVTVTTPIGTSNPLTYTYALQPTSTTVSVSPNTVACGQPVTLTAQAATLPPGGTPLPTGMVTFIVSNDGPALTAPVNAAGQATATLHTPLTAGAHQVVGVYSGDTNYLGSSSALVPLTVTATPTITVVTASPNPTTQGQSVNVCAQVIATAPGAAVPSGTVTFTGPGGLIQTVAVGPVGQACFSSATLQSGIVNAAYSGQACFAASNGSVSVTVQPTSNCLVTVTPPAGTVTVGQATLLTATVTCNGVPVPNAAVTFTSNGTALGSATTNASGNATATVMFTTPGANTLTATVTAAGTACSCTNVTSTPITVTVQPAGPGTFKALPACYRLNFPPLPWSFVHATLTATGAPPGAVVTFHSDGASGAVLCTAVADTNGTASCTADLTIFQLASGYTATTPVLGGSLTSSSTLTLCL
ncbi:Ig-like domain repeat protein [Streptomyces sioyaensis]|uniref:Ig-like domain repeat protein n=1 Tax=Streptomyces sioyaensis TaxID=67364 RepID=UPI0037CE754A